METFHFTSSTPTELFEHFAEAILQQACRDAKEEGVWVSQALKDDLKAQVPELRMESKSIKGSSIKAVRVSGIIQTTPKVFTHPSSFHQHVFS
jgi:hypothetical protein